MKALNLDALVAEKRTVTLFEKTYEVIDMDVATYLEMVKTANEMTDETSPDEQINASIKVVLNCIPTLTREILIKLNLEKLGKIIKFARGGYDDATEEVAPEAKKAVSKAKKK